MLNRAVIAEQNAWAAIRQHGHLAFATLQLPCWPNGVLMTTPYGGLRAPQDLSWDHAAALYEEVLVAAKYQW